LIRTSSNTFSLVRPGGQVIVGPTVSAYKDGEMFITGLVTDPPGTLQNSYRSGYFIVNKESGEVLWGLGREEWIEELESRGIETEPTLSRPTRIDALF
jgi:hypothetical protein